ncbi:MAG: GDSL-type esterase/lipase family protein [Verrucomicrobiaceae bacterium]
MRTLILFALTLLALPAEQISPLGLLAKRHPDHPALKLRLDRCSPLEAHALITNPHFTGPLKKSQRQALSDYRNTLAANLRASRHPRFPAAKGYLPHPLIGWTVFIHQDLREKHPKETTRALHLLKHQLQDIVDRVPAPIVHYLKQVPLYFSPSENGHAGACHHPSANWLKNNGFPVEMAKSVEFSNILNFEKETRRMPNFALHELAHAYHNHILGDDHPAILAAFQKAKASGKFTNLSKRTGDPKNPLGVTNGPTYGMTNQMEYFAETTEAYFGENDITPYDRASLIELDPGVIPVLEKVWHIKKTTHPVLAAHRILVLGDSITASRHYVVDLQTALHLHGHAPEIIAAGLPSEGVTGLSEPKHPFPRPNVHERLTRALQKAKPDLVIACYGMNDGIYHPFSLTRFEAYQRGLQSLIEQVRASGAKLILVTPPPFDVVAHKEPQDLNAPEFHWEKTYRHYDRDVIAPYARWVLAQKNQVTAVVDAHTPMAAHYAAKRMTDKKYTLSDDGVHINREGHRLLAGIIYQSLGGKPMPPLPEHLLHYYSARQNILSPAWTGHIGHQRPGIKPGLPLDEAKARAAHVLR